MKLPSRLALGPSEIVIVKIHQTFGDFRIVSLDRVDCDAFQRAKIHFRKTCAYSRFEFGVRSPMMRAVVSARSSGLDDRIRGNFPRKPVRDEMGLFHSKRIKRNVR